MNHTKHWVHPIDSEWNHVHAVLCCMMTWFNLLHDVMPLFGLHTTLIYVMLCCIVFYRTGCSSLCLVCLYVFDDDMCFFSSIWFLLFLHFAFVVVSSRGRLGTDSSLRVRVGVNSFRRKDRAWDWDWDMLDWYRHDCDGRKKGDAARGMWKREARKKERWDNIDKKARTWKTIHGTCHINLR